MTTDPSNSVPTDLTGEPDDSKGSKVPILFISFAVAGMVMAMMVLLANSNSVDTTRQARVPDNGGASAVGWQVPDFEAQKLDGETINITDYRGRVVFLNFWATWCIPCQREMPAFSEFMAQGREDAVILAVNNGDEVRNIHDFIDLFGGENVPILLDPDFEVSDGFGVANLPTTYILDGEGVVRHIKLGEITAEDIEAYIASVTTES